MKLYTHATAPNPRRVNVFLAEKNIEVGRVLVDLQAGEHKSFEFMAKNMNGQIPMLELDDGSYISESISICRYFEALNATPSLFGETPKEIASIDMHLRRIELALGRNVSSSWVNGPIVAQMAKGRFTQIPEAKNQSDTFVNNYYVRLNDELADRSMIAGENYSVADITTMCIIDFAEQMVSLKPSDTLVHLARWRDQVGSRPSAKA
ncbi:MAG: glutathione S-transferase [Oceanicoccus sp.]